VAYTFVGLGLADAVTLVAWVLGLQTARRTDEPADLDEPAEPAEPAEPPYGEASEERDPWFLLRPGPAWLYTAVELVAALAIAAGCLAVAPERQQVPSGDHPGGVSLAADTYPARWLHAILAPAEQGGLPEDSVVVSWWSASTLLWYGQRVERLRPDIYIVDDRTRLDDNLGEVWDVVDRFLGQRPVFLIRMSGGSDGMAQLDTMYDLADFKLPDGSTVKQVMSKKEAT
jgi:hypothetical protein